MQRPLVKLAILFLIGLGVLLTRWELIPLIEIYPITVILSLLGIVFIWRSLKREKQRIKIHVKWIIILTLIWFSLPLGIMHCIEIPLKDILWIAIVFAICVLISLAYYIQREMSDIDRNGHRRWTDISQQELSLTLLTTAFFTIGVIFSVYAYFHIDYTSKIALISSILGIIFSRRR